ncbi:MAG: SAM hydrolase/SAM-dependent halogenase family protein [Desulfobacterales bacterium]
MPVITLLTDFGTHDAYVAIMKGVILKINPQATIVDITHRIEPQDVHQAAYAIASSYRYFPSETVHVVVVDPGVGSCRAVVALRLEDQTFLAPDNGVLSTLLEKQPVENIVKVENSDYFLHPVSRTFHGRDVFAPVGAHLSLGLPLDRLGAAIESGALVHFDLVQPLLENEGRLSATVIDVDRFGNLITNIDWPFVKRHYPAADHNSLRLAIGGYRLNCLSPTYDSVKPGTPLALIGSRGFFEISINQGSAARFFAARRGTSITVWIDSSHPQVP